MDTDALASALMNGVVAGAGIDVLPGEPPEPSAPLIKLWQTQTDGAVNLIITPHVAFYSDTAMSEMRIKAAQEVRRALKGEPLLNCINGEWLKPSRAALHRV